MKKAADELYQLPETDTESSAPSEENEEWKTNGKNKHSDFLYIQTLYNGNQEEQNKLKTRKVVDELYQLSLAPKVYLSKENETLWSGSATMLYRPHGALFSALN
ncbi:hypothetical protein EVAR_66772_1 [Eumeta japonica]|uniref:Uncharacterized protein n=1 Tax=Eumeta variegata TaxID=151549 RepID=A0A4C1Z386_EUMVA|nr:hypothetical protein EVAR_66772_1 [Eumeta japonica]